MAESFKGVMPFLVSDIIRVVLLVSLPSISLFLVRLMY
jgi:C4-dicarboxylate transporter, DctM subunit